MSIATQYAKITILLDNQKNWNIANVETLQIAGVFGEQCFTAQSPLLLNYKIQVLPYSCTKIPNDEFRKVNCEPIMTKMTPA